MSEVLENLDKPEYCYVLVGHEKMIVWKNGVTFLFSFTLALIKATYV